MSSRRKDFGLNTARVISSAALAFVLCSMLTGCLVAGYGTDTGGYLFPGGLALVFVLAALLWFLCRRR